MIQIIEVDGKKFHADDDGIIILDENNEPIPASICLCFAHCASECNCSAWDLDDEWESNDDYFS